MKEEIIMAQNTWKMTETQKAFMGVLAQYA